MNVRSASSVRWKSWTAQAAAGALLVHALSPWAAAESWKEARPAFASAARPLPAVPDHLLPIVDKTLDVSPRLRNARAAGAPATLSTLPDRLAELRRVESGSRPGMPFVVLVQDAHAVHSAQTNIAGALAHLAGREALLVGMEGAGGAFRPDLFRLFRDRPWHAAAVDHLVKCGFLTGAEAFAATAERAPVLWGIEEAGLYKANVDAYRRGLPLRAETGRILAAWRAALDRAGGRVLTPALAALEADLSSYHAGALSLTKLIRRLGGGGLDRAAFPQAALFLEALALEDGLDFKRVEAERLSLLESLASRLDERRLKELLDRSLAYRAGRLDHAGFYEELRRTAARHGVPLEKRPAFDAYVRYVLAADRVEAGRLLEEITGLEAAAVARLALTPEAKEWMETSRDLRVAERLAEHALTPSDWTAYLSRRASVAGLPARAARFGAAPVADWTGRLAPLEDFYRAALARNRVMVEGLLKKASASGVRTAALVAGGFHTEGLEEELRRRGAPFAVLMPRLEVRADAPRALDMFSPDRTPLEKALLGQRLHLGHTPATAGSPLLDEENWLAGAARSQFVLTAAAAATLAGLKDGSPVEGPIPAEVGEGFAGAGLALRGGYALKGNVLTVETEAPVSARFLAEVEPRPSVLSEYAGVPESLANQPPLTLPDGEHDVALALPRPGPALEAARRAWNAAAAVSRVPAVQWGAALVAGVLQAWWAYAWVIAPAGVRLSSFISPSYLLWSSLAAVAAAVVLSLSRDGVWMENGAFSTALRERLMAQDTLSPEEATLLLDRLRFGNKDRLQEYYNGSKPHQTERMVRDLGGNLNVMTDILRRVRPRDELDVLRETAGFSDRQLDVARAASEFILQGLKSPTDVLPYAAGGAAPGRMSPGSEPPPPSVRRGQQGETIGQVRQVPVRMQPPVSANVNRLRGIKALLASHPEEVAALVLWFEARFNPLPEERGREPALRAAYEAMTGRLEHPAAREAFSLAGDLVQGTLRTDYFLDGRISLGFRLDPGRMALFKDKARFPRTPYAGLFIHVPYGAWGFHFRHGALARGGLRELNRLRDELRATAIDVAYDLSAKQHLKNVGLRRWGSKGAFFPETGRNALALGVAVTEVVMNFRRERPEVMVQLGEPGKDNVELGPDEGTATLSGLATVRALMKDTPKARTLMSGKPAALGGTPHAQNWLDEEQGNHVTSLGVMRSVHHGLRGIGLDPRTDAVRLSVTGGMEGDVGAGDVLIGMRAYGERAVFVQLTDGRGVAFDPAGLDHAELRRLYDAPVTEERFIVNYHLSEERRAAGAFVARTFTRSADDPPLPDVVLEAATLAHLNTAPFDPWILEARKMPVPAGLVVLERGADGRPSRVSVPAAYLGKMFIFAARAHVFVPGGGPEKTVNGDNVGLWLDEAGKPVIGAMHAGANSYFTPPALDFMEAAGIHVYPDEKANSRGVNVSLYQEVDLNLMYEPRDLTQAVQAKYFRSLQKLLQRREDQKYWAVQRERHLRARAGEADLRVANRLSVLLSEEILRVKELLAAGGMTLSDPEVRAAAVALFPDAISAEELFRRMPVEELENGAVTFLANQVVLNAGARYLRETARSTGRGEREVVFTYARLARDVDLDGIKQREVYDRSTEFTPEEMMARLEAIEAPHQARVLAELKKTPPPSPSTGGSGPAGAPGAGSGGAEPLAALASATRAARGAEIAAGLEAAKPLLDAAFPNPARRRNQILSQAERANHFLLTALLAREGHALAARAAEGLPSDASAATLSREDVLRRAAGLASLGASARALLETRSAGEAREGFAAQALEAAWRAGALAGVSGDFAPALGTFLEELSALALGLFPRASAGEVVPALAGIAAAGAEVSPSSLARADWVITAATGERLSDAEAWREMERTLAAAAAAGPRRVLLLPQEAFEAHEKTHPAAAAAVRAALGKNAFLVPRRLWEEIRGDKGFRVDRLGELARKAGLKTDGTLEAGRDFAARLLTETPDLWDLTGIDARDRDAVVAFLLKDVFFAVKPGDVRRVLELKSRLEEVLGAQA